MSASVFISYSRRNRPFAERLYFDLNRAGLDVWLDLSDIPPGADFEQRILPAIAERSHLVLLASPDAADSEWVRREVSEARSQHKTVIPLRLAGRSGTMPAEWERLNMIEGAALDYWGTVRRLARSLHAPRPQLLSLTELLNLQVGTTADAAAELTGAEEVTDAAGRSFVKLPVAPSAYAMTWLFAPLAAPLARPSALGVLFNFTSDYPGSRYKGALAHWAGQVVEPWMVMLEGPVNRQKHEYDVRTDHEAEWEDCIAAGTRLLEEHARGRDRLGYYLNCLVPLAFEVGLRTRMLAGPRRVFHFNARKGEYELAADGWK